MNNSSEKTHSMQKQKKSKKTLEVKIITTEIKSDFVGLISKVYMTSTNKQQQKPVSSNPSTT
jgi:hypothetical protein